MERIAGETPFRHNQMLALDYVPNCLTGSPHLRNQRFVFEPALGWLVVVPYERIIHGWMFGFPHTMKPCSKKRLEILVLQHIARVKKTASKIPTVLLPKSSPHHPS
jgi:hypothetical protein